MFELVPFSRAAVSLLVVPYRFSIRSCVRTPSVSRWVPPTFLMHLPWVPPCVFRFVIPCMCSQWFSSYISPAVNVGFSVPFRVLLRAFIVKIMQFLSVSCSFCGRFLGVFGSWFLMLSNGFLYVSPVGPCNIHAFLVCDTALFLCILMVHFLVLYMFPVHCSTCLFFRVQLFVKFCVSCFSRHSPVRSDICSLYVLSPCGILSTLALHFESHMPLIVCRHCTNPFPLTSHVFLHI